MYGLNGIGGSSSTLSGGSLLYLATAALSEAIVHFLPISKRIGARLTKALEPKVRASSSPMVWKYAVYGLMLLEAVVYVPLVLFVLDTGNGLAVALLVLLFSLLNALFLIWGRAVDAILKQDPQ